MNLKALAIELLKQESTDDLLYTPSSIIWFFGDDNIKINQQHDGTYRVLIGGDQKSGLTIEELHQILLPKAD